MTAPEGAGAGASAARPFIEIADAPQLPDAPPPVLPLKRGPNGAIETIGPSTERRAGKASCQRGTLCVGPRQTYPTLGAALAAAHDGSVIEIVGGTYRESATIAANHVVLRGVAGRPLFDCAGANLAGGWACLLLAGDGITLDNLEITGAAKAAATDQAAACLGTDAGKGVTLSRVFCHGSANGLVAHGGTILIENSEFYDNGWTSRSSNVALDGTCAATIRGTIIRDARLGEELISRCKRMELTASTVRSLAGGTELDFPDGGETTIYRTTIEKRRGAADSDLLRFATESCLHPGSVLLKQVHIINSQVDAVIRNADRCDNKPIVLENLTVQGIPPQLAGFILKQ
jgi:hypothetical protein